MRKGHPKMSPGGGTVGHLSGDSKESGAEGGITLSAKVFSRFSVRAWVEGFRPVRKTVDFFNFPKNFLVGCILPGNFLVNFTGNSPVSK